MISENMAKKLQHQMNREIYSGYLYLGMAAYADSTGKPGFAHWFRRQFHEELEHAERFYDYLINQGARVMMEPIEQPPQEFSSAPELFEKTLAHEKAVTGLIHDLVEAAKQEDDKATEEFLQWFVKEQIEEELTPANIIKKIDNTGRDEAGVAKIDEQLVLRK
ncbi:MAG: ferritin [Candidatus Omnitrophica bacterium]|nr:ferritin [Candidatus Omnitrophota bacterium]